MDKARIRREMNALLGAMPAAERADRSARVAARLQATDAWQKADAVLSFLSMPKEIDTAAVIAAARAGGKTVAVPLMDGDDIRFVVLPPDAGTCPATAGASPSPTPRGSRSTHRAPRARW